MDKGMIHVLSGMEPDSTWVMDFIFRSHSWLQTAFCNQHSRALRPPGCPKNWACRGVTMCFWEKLCSLPGGWWSLGHPGPSVRSLSALSSLSSLSQFAVQIVTFSLYVLVWKNSGKYWLYWTTRTMFKGMDDLCSLLPVISWHALLRMHSLLLSQYTGIALWLGGLRVRCHQAADLVLCVTTQLFVMCGSLKN